VKAIDGESIRRAIRSAEDGTSGRIGVHVTHKRVQDLLEYARAAFHHAGLHQQPDGNAVLFVVAPKTKKFAVYGGDALHALLGDAFWKHLIEEMTPHFAEGRPTDGLITGIERVGDEMRAHFGKAVTA
jgi:uncharacterized membrane protein